MKFISFKHNKEAKFGILNNQLITDLTNKIKGANTLKDLIANNDILIPELVALKKISGDVPWKDFEDYEKRRCRLKEERRLLRILQRQASESLTNELTSALQVATNGTLISIRTSSLQSKVVPAVIVNKLEGINHLPLLLCLTNSNIWILISCESVVSMHAELNCMDVKLLKPPILKRIGEFNK